jgi:hypothetical protein
VTQRVKRPKGGVLLWEAQQRAQAKANAPAKAIVKALTGAARRYKNHEPQGCVKRQRVHLTPELSASLVTVGRTGVSLAAVAGYAGISPETLRQWRRRGEAQLARRENGERVAKAEQIYIAFLVEFEKARAELQLELVANVRNAFMRGEQTTVVTQEATPEEKDPKTQQVITPAQPRRKHRTSQRWQVAAWLLERLFPDDYGRRGSSRWTRSIRARPRK